jgi:hypothetical protein
MPAIQTCCIVIPIYKQFPSETEIVSFQQALTLLPEYTIVFVTHKKLDCAVYMKIGGERKAPLMFEYFYPTYFASLHGYNALMLSKEFYDRFCAFRYMLIYQLDAYIFSNQLEFWCKQNYDYIGAPAPWNSQENDELDRMAVGNGGFSLRKIATFSKLCRIFGTSISIIRFVHFCYAIYNAITKKARENIAYMFLRIVLYIPMKILFLAGQKIFSKYGELNEDVIWSYIISQHGLLPTVGVAAKFAFELCPELLFKLNNGVLPFGCHSLETKNTLQFLGKYRLFGGHDTEKI